MKKTGAILILDERIEQIHKHGFDVESDLIYKHGELTMLVEYLIKNDSDAERDEIREWLLTDAVGYKFNENFINKLDSKSRVERLVIAGALIAAEIDRINNLEK